MKPVPYLSELGRRTEDPPISWLMKLTLEHPRLISLAAGFTDSPSLPTREARDILDAMLRSRKKGMASLQYGRTDGDPQLRELTTQDLQNQDTGVPDLPLQAPYLPEHLLITNGSQQFLYMISEALFNPGDIVLVEDPTYFVFLGIAQSHGVHCRGVGMDEDGINLEKLERKLDRLKRENKLKRLKMVYLVTYFQNPSGRSTSFAKKTAVLEMLKRYERAAGHPIFLLEDAAYRELRFEGSNIPSALGSGSDRVIYSGTYSKPFATGARVGFGLLPEALFKVVHRIKGNHDFGTSNLTQQLLLQALLSGTFERHLEKIRARYRRKGRLMHRSLQEHFPEGVQWDPPRGGLYIWARLARRIKTGPGSSLFENALRRDVLYVPGLYCYGPDPTRKKPNHEMRLSFGNASPEDIRTGIQRLGRIIRKELKG